MAARTRFEKDYYKIVGVRPEATEEEIRPAYRRLALQWHPDRNPQDPHAEERFKEISEAYAVLIDPAKRREYDRFRQFGTAGDFRHTREDLFRDLFADPRASAIFEELAREFERMGMRVDRHHFHRTLFGGRTVVTGGVFVITPFTPVLAAFRLARAALRGARAGSSITTPRAEALPRPRGILQRVARTGRWLLGLPPALAQAQAGEDVTLTLRLTPAEAERGGQKRLRLGRDNERDEVLVTIPPGVRAGTKLRLRGKGHDAPGGQPGDMYLAIEITDEA